MRNISFVKKFKNILSTTKRKEPFHFIGELEVLANSKDSLRFNIPQHCQYNINNISICLMACGKKSSPIFIEIKDVGYDVVLSDMNINLMQSSIVEIRFSPPYLLAKNNIIQFYFKNKRDFVIDVKVVIRGENLHEK